MADVKRSAPADRHRQPTKPTRGQHTAGVTEGRRQERRKPEFPDDAVTLRRVRHGDEDRAGVAPASAARQAAEIVATLSGRRPESVISIERTDGGWRVGVEVVEVARIPDSADILAVYDVRLDADGDLISYRRLHRYARGHAEWEPRR
jgi:hypothetical protein